MQQVFRALALVTVKNEVKTRQLPWVGEVSSGFFVRINDDKGYYQTSFPAKVANNAKVAQTLENNSGASFQLEGYLRTENLGGAKRGKPDNWVTFYYIDEAHVVNSNA